MADLGFYGVSRKMAGYAVPHFQVVLGGEWEGNAASYGLPIVAVPSKNVPGVADNIDTWPTVRAVKVSRIFIKRIGKVEIKSLLEDLTRLPADNHDRSFFSRRGRPARI